jgi:hypothetical protein
MIARLHLVDARLSAVDRRGAVLDTGGEEEGGRSHGVPAGPRAAAFTFNGAEEFSFLAGNSTRSLAIDDRTPRKVRRSVITSAVESEAAEMTSTDRFLMANTASGIVLGFVVAAAIILLDLHGIGTLLMSSDKGLVAAILLAAGFSGLAGAGLFSTAMAWLPPRPRSPGGGAGRLAPVIAASCGRS